MNKTLSAKQKYFDNRIVSVLVAAFLSTAGILFFYSPFEFPIDKSYEYFSLASLFVLSIFVIIAPPYNSFINMFRVEYAEFVTQIQERVESELVYRLCNKMKSDNKIVSNSLLHSLIFLIMLFPLYYPKPLSILIFIYITAIYILFCASLMQYYSSLINYSIISIFSKRIHRYLNPHSIIEFVFSVLLFIEIVGINVFYSLNASKQYDNSELHFKLFVLLAVTTFVFWSIINVISIILLKQLIKARQGKPSLATSIEH